VYKKSLDPLPDDDDDDDDGDEDGAVGDNHCGQLSPVYFYFPALVA